MADCSEPRGKRSCIVDQSGHEIALTNLQAGKEITYSMSFQGNGLYIFVNEGAIRIEGESLGKRDGCRDL